MTLREQQVLGMAIALVKKEFEKRRADEETLQEMDLWIERFGLQYGITWKVTHQLEEPDPKAILPKPATLTFTASVYTPVHEMTLTVGGPDYN